MIRHRGAGKSGEGLKQIHGPFRSGKHGGKEGQLTVPLLLSGSLGFLPQYPTVKFLLIVEQFR